MRGGGTGKGRAGEEAAAAWLAAGGWLIRARNFRVARGEIDIIATRGETIAFVEVKSWSALPASELEHSSCAARRFAACGRASTSCSWTSRSIASAT